MGSGCCPGQIQEEVLIRGLQLVQRLPPVWHHGRCQQWAAARLLFPEIFCGKQWQEEKNKCQLTKIHYARQNSKRNSC